MKFKYRRIIVLAGPIVVLLLVPVIVTDVRWLVTANLILLSAVIASGLYWIAALGLVSFAQAAFAGIGAYTMSILLLRTGTPFAIAWIGGGVVAALTAGIIGMIVLRMKGAYFFLVSCALNQFVMQVFNGWDSLTGGEDGLTNIPPPSLLDSPGELYYLSLALLAATLIYMVRIENSRFGLALRATLENDSMVQSYGFSPFRIKMMNWMTCCFVTGLAGGLQALVYYSIFPTMYDFLVSLRYLVYLVFGGMFSPMGALTGSVVITLLAEFLRPVKEWVPLVYGLILILTFVLLPGGLLSLFRKRRA